MRGRRLGLLWLGVVMLAAGCSSTPATNASSSAPPTAKTFTGLPQVGALFAGAVQGGVHLCTASVVDSPGRNLLITAAHCVYGAGSSLVFAPGYHDGSAPFGAWNVESAYVSPRWLTDQDPQSDFAFLVVAAQQRSGRTTNVEDVVGADRLVVSRGFHVRATVVGYPLATDSPIECSNQTYEHLGFPAFDCAGYVDGTSGGPWITDLDPRTHQGDVYGVIGGLHQGGCTSQVSYSSYFASGIQAVYTEATQGGPGDFVPSAGSDGCPGPAGS